MLGLENSEAFKTPECMEAAKWLATLKGFDKSSFVLFAAAFYNQTLCCISPPSVGMAEIGDEFTCRELAQLRSWSSWLVLVADSVNTAMAVRGLVQTAAHNLFAEVGGDVGSVLDNSMIHIENVEGIIWCGVGIDRSKSLVG